MKRFASLLGLLVLATTLACGGGGDSGTDRGVFNDSGSSNNLAADMTPDEPNPGSDDVSVETVGTSGNLVTVAFTVTDTSDVFGAAFDVVFDPSMIEFAGWSPGRLLEHSGETAAYQVSSAVAGTVVVGASRQGSATGSTASGTERLVELTFRSIAAGASGLTFRNSVLLNSQSPPQTIGGISWHGGTFTAN
jgi:hypothetical protein